MLLKPNHVKRQEFSDTSAKVQEEDKAYQIDSWAELFKSKTWEEMKMLAEKSKYIDEAAKTVFRMSAEEQVIKRCRDREDYYSDLWSYQKEIEKRVTVQPICCIYKLQY